MIQGARADDMAMADAPDISAADPGEIAAYDEPDRTERRWPARLAVAVLALAAAAWVALLGLVVASAAPAGLSALRLLAWIGIGAGPLALIGIVALLLFRGERLRTTTYLAASARLRADAGALGDALARLHAQVAGARAELQGHAATLAGLGAETGERLTRAAAELGGQATAFRHTAATLDEATATARADLGVLLADLPRAQEATETLAERLRAGAGEADVRARALTELLGTLEERARAASDASGGAAARLAGQLDRIDEGSAGAGARIAEAASGMRGIVDGALEAAATGVERTRAAVADQSAALVAMVEQGKAALEAAGDDAARRMGARLDRLMTKLDGVAAGLAQQDEGVRALLAGLDEAVNAAAARLATLGEAGTDQTLELGRTLARLHDHLDGVAQQLAVQDRAATSLLDRVTQVRGQAEAGSVTLGETLPAALARVRLHAEQSLQAIAIAAERGERLYDTAEAVHARLGESHAVLEAQQGMLDEANGQSGQRLALMTDRAAALRTLIARIDAEMRDLSDGAAGGLVETLFRVREAATAAGAEASDAITAAIPRAAQRLGESASRALTSALADIGQAEIDAVGAASAQALEAARAASERLSHQLLTIAETATAIDARIAANQADTQAHDEAAFARTAALLIEALNSASIDLTRLFAQEVSEEAWKSYLRGDRGIFTRRAVKLLERAEAGAVVQRYESDGDFQAQVNRYIHDFEALLRRVIATHEGVGLATTLLSSDMGKLYVALAQAIERLRR